MSNGNSSPPGLAKGVGSSKTEAQAGKNNDLEKCSATNFKFEGAKIRTSWIGGSPWFLAADLCRALKLSVKKGVGPALRNLDDDEKRQVSREQFFAGHPVNGGQEFENGSPAVWLISESALYLLAMRSQSALRDGTVAYRFRSFVTREVLPAIRKTGAYTAAAGNAEQLSFDPTEQARYVVAVVPGKPPHVRKTQLDAMLDEWSAFDTEILANHMRTVDALWQKTQLVRSVGGDPADSPLYNRLGKAISDARRIADECLDSFRQQPV